MKKLLVLVLMMIAVVTLVVGCSHSTEKETVANGKGNIKVTVENSRSKNGPLHVSVFNSQQSFSDKNPLERKTIPATDNKMELTFTDLPFGKYIVIAIHDENGNNDLDFSEDGKPAEGFGISNNNFGPPDYEKAEVLLDKAELEVPIQLVYYR